LPDVDEEIWCGLAVLGIHKRHLEVQGDAAVALDDVAADLLAVDEVRADDVVGGQDTGAIGPKDLGIGRIGRVLEGTGLVVRGSRPFGKISVVAPMDVGVVPRDSPFLAKALESFHAAFRCLLCAVSGIDIVAALAELAVVQVRKSMSDSGIQQGLRDVDFFSRVGENSWEQGGCQSANGQETGVHGGCSSISEALGFWVVCRTACGRRGWRRWEMARGRSCSQ
jgi:hypothetical protein